MNKKTVIETGFIVRFIGMVFVILSLPFFVTNPSNIISFITFAFGNFLLTIGGALN